MALPSTRVEYRIALSHVDRGIKVSQAVIAAHHPSETAEHLTLRILAWCLLYEESISFAAGLSDPDAADLWAHDLTGRLSLWIECGAADGVKLRRVVQHHADAQVHAVFAGDRRRKDLLDQVASWPRPAKGFERVELWSISPELVAALAAHEDRRHRWSVTIVGDHLYVEAEGKSLDGPVERSRPFGE